MIRLANRSAVIGAALVVTALAAAGCSSEPGSPADAIRAYVDAVNARDEAALEALAPQVYDPSEYAQWVLTHSPATPMTVDRIDIERSDFHVLRYAHVTWVDHGFPADGEFVLSQEDMAWKVGPKDESGPLAEPAASASPTDRGH